MDCQIVGYDENYCNDISSIITRNLLEEHSKVYGIEKMLKDSLKFTPEMITEHSKTRRFFVALDGETVVGTVAVAKNKYAGEYDYVILTVFVLPEHHGKGIGKLLVEHAEMHVQKLSGKTISIPAAIPAQGFYRKMGYDYADGNEPNSDGFIWMERVL